MRNVARGTIPKPAYGNGLTATSTLEPQTCLQCGAELMIIYGAIIRPGLGVAGCEPDEVACRNGCEECV